MEIVLLFTAVAGIIWFAVWAIRGSLLVSLLGLLLIGACFGYHFARWDAGPITLTLDRAGLVAVFGAYLIARRMGHTRWAPLELQDWILGAFIALLTFSTVLGGYIGQGQDDVPSMWRLIAGYYIPATIYWMAREVPMNERRFRLLLGAFTGFGIYLGLTGIAEMTGQWWAVFPRHIADPTVGMHFGRARGPMVALPTYGVYLGVCLLAAWLWLPRLSRWGQLCLTMAAPIFFAGIFLSLTRSVWIGVGLGIMTTLFFTLRDAWRPLVLGSIIIGGGIIGLTQIDKIVGLQREETAAEAAMSANMRLSFAYVSWKMFLDHPLLGVGFGNFPSAKLPYLEDRSTDLQLDIIRTLAHHNTFLSLLTETGALGLALFLALLAAWTRTAWRRLRDPEQPEWARGLSVLLLGSLGIYVAQLMFHDLTYTPTDNALLYFLAGLTVAIPVRARSRTEEPSTEQLHNSPWRDAAAPQAELPEEELAEPQPV